MEQVFPFVKMHGARNDYVFLDCRDDSPPADPAGLARVLSDRHAGVGGDGLILVESSTEADGRMRMYNADGSRAEMCGNGLRCVALLLTAGQPRAGVSIMTDRGLLTADVLDEPLAGGRMVRIDMDRPLLSPTEIPTTLSGCPPLDCRLSVDGGEVLVSAVSMGNPHAVLFVERLRDADFAVLGPRLERHASFPQGVNVEFVEVLDAHSLRMRVWERGTGETQACGTGACAAVVVGILQQRLASPVNVELPGGHLRVEWPAPDASVFLTGPAQEVFRGQWVAL